MSTVSVNSRLCLSALVLVIAGCAVGTATFVPPDTTATVSLYFPPGTAPIEIDAGPTKEPVAYPVFFGTTRKFGNTGLSEENGPFSSQRDSKINYGRAWVFIPKHHQIGSLGSWFGTVTGSDPYVKLEKIESFKGQGDFEDTARKMLKSLTGPEEGYVVVYIHGYNNSLGDAAIRAAQFGADIGVPKGHMFLFSWASKGSTLDYTVDEATIDASEVYFSEFLGEIATRIAPDRKVHVVAHSMGNRALLRVISKGLLGAANDRQIRFGQIILAAADVDRDLFAALAPSYLQFSDRTTVYLSPYDFAVELSEHLHDYARVGCGTAPQVVVPGIDNVVSTLTSDFLAHAYFAETLPVLTDIKNLILRNEPARTTGGWEKRQGYWVVGGTPDWNKVKCITTNAASVGADTSLPQTVGIR